MRLPEQIPQPVEEETEYHPFTASAYEWSKAFVENRSLLHVDFSFNHFNSEDIKVIGKAGYL